MPAPAPSASPRPPAEESCQVVGFAAATSPRISRLVLRDTVLVLLLGLYVASFWGNFHAHAFWPTPVRHYSGWVVRWLGEACRPYLPGGPHLVDHSLLLWTGVSWTLGVLVPLAVAALFSRRPGDLGLRLPNRWGWRMVCVCLGVVVPFAFLFAWEQRAAGLRPPPWSYCTLVLAVTVAEHFLLTGVCPAVLLSGCRLPPAREPLPPTARPWHRALDWLGLAQPADAHAGPFVRFLAWWGLDPPALAAMTGAGALFGLVHVGARPIEFATSFPGGFALAYLTLRSGSIWPGWIIHGVLMGIVLVLIA